MPSKSGLCYTQPCAALHTNFICWPWRCCLSSILILAGCAANTYLEAATAYVAFLPAVGLSHASRTHGRESGYFEEKLGEEVLTKYKCFLQGELWRGSGGREHGKSWGALQRAWGTGRLCWGRRGGLQGPEGISVWVRAVVGNTWYMGSLDLDTLSVSYKLHRVFPYFLIKQQVVWKWIHLSPCLQTTQKWLCAVRTFPDSHGIIKVNFFKNSPGFLNLVSGYETGKGRGKGVAYSVLNRDSWCTNWWVNFQMIPIKSILQV